MKASDLSDPDLIELIAEAWWNTPPRKNETWADALPGSKFHFRMRAREFVAELVILISREE